MNSKTKRHFALLSLASQGFGACSVAYGARGRFGAGTSLQREPEPEPEPEPQPEPEPEPEPPEPTWLESFFCDEPYTQGWPDVPARRVCNAGAVAITAGLFFCAVFMALSIVCVVRRRMGQVLKVHPAEFDRPDSRDRPVTPVVEPQRPGPPSGKNNNTRRAKQYMIPNSPAAGSPGRKPRTP